MRTVFIGGGVMGEAILSSALERGVVQKEAVLVCEKIPDRREELVARYGIDVTDDLEAAMGQGDVVILAVKPQDLAALVGASAPGAVVVSVMAGVRIETISEIVGHNRVVRVMPNTPVAIQRGMSAWTATPDVGDEQRAFVRDLLASIGDELYLEAEAKLDMATAISGSGPAYVFLFIEALIDAGVGIGLTRAEAAQLAMQTVAGSAEYAKGAERGPAELRAMVSSPGGTTIAGTRELERHAFRAAIIDCVDAAFRRAQELGGG